MIVIPAIIAGAGAILKPILIAAGIGALFGAGTSGVGEAVTGIQEHGTFNREVAANTFHAATQGAAEGALIGGAFGAVGIVAAPLAPVVGGAISPAIGAVDDAARPVIHALDDAVRPALDKASNAVKSVSRSVTSKINRARNALNARFFDRLPKGAGNRGYVYVMDDVAKADRYKIGKTIEPSQRLKAVQKTIGGKVNFACIIPTDNMKLLENALHAEFASQRIPNFGAGIEWFRLNPAQLGAACSK